MKKDLHACCDALFVVLKGHILAIACSELGISNPDAKIPSAPPKGGCSVSDCRSFIESLATRVVHRCSIVEGALLNHNVDDTNDSVYNYACILCHLASLALELTDAWREGDGVVYSVVVIEPSPLLFPSMNEVCSSGIMYTTSVSNSTSTPC